MSKKQKSVFEGKLIRLDTFYGTYELGTKKAKFCSLGKKYGYEQSRGFLFGFCRNQFEKTTGIKLMPGEEVMVKITIETTPMKVKK
jgi:hypothetical protein